MKKLLIMTVGTGRDVEHGIATSVETNNPDFICFIATQQSQDMPQKVAEAFRQLCQQELPEYEIRMLQKESAVDEAYRTTREAIENGLQKGYSRHQIYLDFTSGTKSMSVGASLAAVLCECQRMIYTGGSRRDEQGRVISGSEEVKNFTPVEVFTDYKQQLARQMFNAYQFDAGLKILQESQRQFARQDITQLEMIFQAYERWDKFDHKGALKFFDNPAISHDMAKVFGGNKGFVAQIVKARHEDAEAIVPELMVDLFANAQRRAKEGKFDDAVARLYRITEMIAQFVLQQKGLKTGDIDIALLPESLREKYEAQRDESGKVMVALKNAYTLLDELGEQALAERYMNSSKLRGLLTERNRSILAHGSQPIDETVYDKLVVEVEALIQLVVSNMKPLLTRATMIKLS